MTAEEKVAAGESQTVGVTLTEEQKQFLAACEAEFADRYTEADQEFVQYKDRVSVPPIVDPWYNKPRHNFDWSAQGKRHQNFGSRNDRGHNQGGYRQGGEGGGYRQGGEGGGYRQGGEGGGYRQGDRFYGHRHRSY